ncbi:MAG: dockerin type I domain-containing protein [Oscillospiraceae bacterium]|nr:dockerin type I domain-containing protein [Oscillospiraceae bacterium]
MSYIKKSAAVFLSVVIILSIMWTVPVVSGASSVIEPSRMTFEQYVVTSLENYVAEIEIAYYIQNNRDWLRRAQSDVSDFIQDVLGEEILRIHAENPQLFHVTTSPMVSYTSDFSAFNLIFDYFMTPAEYNAAKGRMETAINEALNYAKSAENDFEKALFLHDYIVLNTIYDSENLAYLEKNNYSTPLRENSHTAYGVLVDGLAVCDGYARAYLYLLRRAGVESRVITGTMKGGPHIWNLVKIDGYWYHADTTASDPVAGDYDVHGLVTHKYFLLSTDGLRAVIDNSGRQTHNDFSLPAGITANSTAYDNAFFRTINTAIVKHNGHYYWIASTPSVERGLNNNSLMRYNISSRTITTVHSFSSIWYLDGTETDPSYSFEVSSYVGVAVYDGKIYFNTAKEIYAYNIAAGEIEIIHSPANLGGTGNRFIFGLAMSENIISYSIRVRVDSAGTIERISVQPAAQPTEPEEPPPPPQPPTDTVIVFTSADALTVLKYGVGMTTLTAEQYEKYDLNNDGRINASDALVILQVVVGLVQV